MSDVLNPILGSILKFAVTASVVGVDVHLNDGQVGFKCTFWAKNALKRRLTLTKEDMKPEPESADCYLAVIDTSLLGRGEYWLDMEVTFPDSDADTGVRVERGRIYTGVRVS